MMIRTALTLVLAAAASSLRAAAPAYPVSGIVGPWPDGQGAAGAASADPAALGSYRLLYSSDGAPLEAVRDARAKLAVKTPVLVYMGGLTTNNDDVAVLERSYRSAAAMTPVGHLAAELDATADSFTVSELTDGEFAIKASTASESSVEDTGKYSFWVRIDDELLRVTRADGHSHEVTVERGFAGSRAAAHRAGATVLTPVYLGSRDQLGAARHTNSWPGGPNYLRYALDPRQPAAQQLKAAIVVADIRNGFDGAWFDTFQPVPYNLCDALGRPVKYFWDFKAGRIYAFASYLDALKDYVRGVRAEVKRQTGREPILFANSASRSYAMGTKQLFNAGAEHGLLDGYCFEDSFLRVDASRTQKGGRGRVNAQFAPLTGVNWLRNVTNESDAARSGLNAFCMMGPAGYLAAYINESQPNYARLVRYAYASYLLTVTAERSTSFGIPCLVSPSPLKIQPWPKILSEPIGDPLQPNQIAKLKVAGEAGYAREFQHGWVAVNAAADGSALEFQAPSGYAPTTVRLSPGDAAILLKQ